MTDLPALYTDAMRQGVSWGLLRHVWRSFDSGGESNRSLRSRALETAMAQMRHGLPDKAVSAVCRAADTNYSAFAQLAAQCQSHDDLVTRLESERREGLEPLPGVEGIVEGGAARQGEMAELLRHHGWPDEVDGAWLIFYDDKDVAPEIFMGYGAETCAKQRLAQAAIGYTVHLFRRVATA